MNSCSLAGKPSRLSKQETVEETLDGSIEKRSSHGLTRYHLRHTFRNAALASHAAGRHGIDRRDLRAEDLSLPSDFDPRS